MKRIFRTMLIAAAIPFCIACGNTAKTPQEKIEENAEKAINAEKLPFEIKDNVIFNENVPVVVDFYATWCPPCKQYAPTFEAVAEKYEGSVCFVSLNTEEYPELCKTYEIEAIPTTVFIMPGGSVLGKETGALPMEELEAFVNQLINTSAGADMEI